MNETKYTVKFTTVFRKDYKKAKKRRLPLEKLKEVVDLLAMGQPLPERNRDHALTGDWVGHRECHIQPDWLLIYRVEEDVLVLTMTRTGTHSELFGCRAPYGETCTADFLFGLVFLRVSVYNKSREFIDFHTSLKGGVPYVGKCICR